MKETLTEIQIPNLPETKEDFQALLIQQIGTPQGAAAVFVVALNILLKDADLGRSCLDMIRLGDPMSDGEFNASFLPICQRSPEIARSYLKGATPDNGYCVPDGESVIFVKTTDERGIRKKAKTVYIGCNGTGSYRPITLASKPPRYVRKRFGVRCEYETDPWFVTDYPSLLLPVKKV